MIARFGSISEFSNSLESFLNHLVETEGRGEEEKKEAERKAARKMKKMERKARRAAKKGINKFENQDFYDKLEMQATSDMSGGYDDSDDEKEDEEDYDEKEGMPEDDIKEERKQMNIEGIYNALQFLDEASLTSDPKIGRAHV